MNDYNAETDISEYDQALAKCLSDRVNAYQVELGGWQEQLDMMFHDFDVWKSRIADIKNRFPKP